MKEKIIIFDTTLRDGEQSPGASLGIKEKLEIAKQLAKLGVDIIEAGFPISSLGDFEAVRLIAQKIKGPVICGLARSIKKDIDTVFNAVKYAKKPRIHVFLATSEIHRKFKLKKAKDEIIKQAVKSVKYAKKLVSDIEFSPEDASRTEPEFLFKVIAEVIDAGCVVVNIPDTVGYAIPDEFGNLISQIKQNVPNIDKAVISIHCHNDLGLGVANSLSAINYGARQVECTINGIGERAGNASLEEIAMAINTRKDFFNFATSINAKQICKTSRLVSNLTGMVVQPNKAIVGQNAFSHEAGIHQDGILKEAITYEIMKPEDVGFGESRLVLGKHSGRHAFGERLKKLGFNLSKKKTDKTFAIFKDLADKKKQIFDDDIIAIVEDEIIKLPEVWKLDYMHTTSGSKTLPTATVRLKKDKKIYQDAACGDGPVDACYKTIDRITGYKPTLENYSLRAVTGGKDALGEVSIKLKWKEEIVNGKGASTDIIEASTKAYLDAINKIAYMEKVK